MSTRAGRPVVAAASLLLLLSLAACAPEAEPGGGIPTVTGFPTRTAEATGPGPTPTATAAAVDIPTDCRAILSDSVLDQLEGVPLNDDAFGPSGVQANGSLICIWAEPGADTTGLTTVISAMSRGPALDMLNGLMNDEGFTCYAPDGGTRCEKTWQNETYPVTDGRTLFWRDDILIDTTFSNLAPSGYTTAIVESIWG